MARASRQKEKILYIAKILLEKTDENHKITVNEIIEELSRQGITAERKSIYSDLETLSKFGLDICKEKTTSTGYYIGIRDFQMPELKLLVDAIQSSKFITTKKSMELIGKLEKLCSVNDAKLLQRQVFVTNRVKTLNEKIYYNVDTLHNALSSGKQITFIYDKWVLDFNDVERIKKQPRRNGELYRVSPWALSWDDENYYLIAYEKESEKLKHYRVDKMQDIMISEVEREGESSFEKFDVASYTKSVFSMFGGKETTVDLSVDNSFIGVIVDRFGKNVFVSRESDDTFCVTVKVVLSPQFFGWLFALGTKVKLLAPNNAVEEFSEYLKDVYKQYNT
ncbi:MAG: WYL domain-containing protein [Ruminococcus sp.]|nr:WYL domain-containing protein [Ruminococcus sp.]